MSPHALANFTFGTSPMLDAAHTWMHSEAAEAAGAVARQFAANQSTIDALVERLRGRVSGLCQPAYILDIPGGHGKVRADSMAVQEADDGCFRLRDFRGGTHVYPPHEGEA